MNDYAAKFHGQATVLRKLMAGCAAVALVAGGAAAAGPKNSSSGSSHAAPAGHSGGFGGGGAHMPGGMGGGAHIPGSMGGGAHIPGSMGGGAHIPGSMGGGAHIPGSMGGAHVPGGVGGGAHAPRSTHYANSGSRSPARHESGQAQNAHGGERDRSRDGHESTHGDRDTTHGSHDTAREHDAKDTHHEAGEHGGGHAAGHADSRVGGNAKLHTRGLDAAMNQHHEPRAYLHPPAHRDIKRDRDFVAAHRDDFHTHRVRDFSARELGVWRGGLWRNEWHYGRRGWWWDVDGVYYPYEDPDFPYPLEVAPLTVYEADTIDGPDLTAVETVPDVQVDAGVAGVGVNVAVTPGAPQAPGIPPLPPAPEGRYSCADPTGYFPGVGACTAPWDLLPTAAAGGTP